MNNASILNPPILIKKISLELNLRFLWVSAFVLIFSLLICYIFQLNLLFSKTNLIKNYEKKLTEVSQNNKNLEINLVRADSLGGVDLQIEEKINELGFEKVKEINYIQVSGGAVAKINKNAE